MQALQLPVQWKTIPDFLLAYAGSHNDKTVMNFSPFFKKAMTRRLPSTSIEYTIDGSTFNHPYWLADGIYPKLGIFALPIKNITSADERTMNEQQESRRKDIECAFGVLQQRFHFLRCGMDVRDVKVVKKTIITCGVIHNMIIKWQQLKENQEGKRSAVIRIFHSHMLH